MSRARSRRVQPRPNTPKRPDRLPDWWRRIGHKLDWAGRVAERLEPSFQNRWVPLVLLAFPILLLALALLVASLR